MFEQLGLIGCGLMGGSFALALKKAGLVKRVVGYSKSPSTTDRARQLGVIDVEAPSALLAVADLHLEKGTSLARRGAGLLWMTPWVHNHRALHFYAREGYADVGLSASENVIKEIHEEAGLEVSVRALYGVRHKAKGPYKADHRDFYKLYFLCERQGTQPPLAGSEATEAGFFAPDQLPPLSQGRTVVSVLHDMSLALQADELLVLRAGRLVHQGPPGDAATREAVQAVFEQSLGIHSLQGQWVALPRMNPLKTSHHAD